MKEGNDIVLEVKDLNVSRGGQKVIENASFTVRMGDYTGIVGPNGGGKTTLVLSVLGQLPRDSGEIRLFGQDIDRFDQWGKVAHVSQDAVNFDYNFPLTVRELISMGRVNRGNLCRKLREEDWKKVDEALDIMAISDLADRRVGMLSGGQKQRAFVAKALVKEPKIIFLDEPLSGVDANAQENFYKVLSNLNQQKGITLLIVSHDLTAVFCRMSRVICVNRMVYESTVELDLDPNDLLKKAYGSHFHFVFHRHSCKGVFDDA